MNGGAAPHRPRQAAVPDLPGQTALRRLCGADGKPYKGLISLMKKTPQTRLWRAIAIAGCLIAAFLTYDYFHPVAGSGGGKVVTTESGLQYTDIVVGTGPSPQPGQTVKVHYVGTLMDGKQFDSSRDRGQPYSFIIGKGNVIKGWDEGVMTMRIGGRRKLIVPPSLGYGARGTPGGPIPGDATLNFDVELIDIL